MSSHWVVGGPIDFAGLHRLRHHPRRQAEAHRVKVYLADLFHVFQAGKNPDTNPYTVPLGIGFLASTVKRYLPHCEVRLFRDPDRLLNAIRSEPPRIVGLSFCSWNSDLSRRVSEIVKTEGADIILVRGGPSVDDADDQILDFFETFPQLDYLVPNEGETGFLALLQAIERNEHRNAAIPGVAYLDEAGHLVRGRYQRPIVPGSIAGSERISPKQVRYLQPGDIEIPSPYLDGTLDEFLDEGLVPIVQTMRGCPYQCHFCVSGATEWNRMRDYDLERVESEIDYALSRSRAKDLILTDENWGILGERDVELAHFIMERHAKEGTPRRLYYYTAKIVTDASKKIVELVAPIAWIGEFSMSFQTLNPATRAAIKRTNIGLDKLAANVQWARERNIRTSSEMIYGFPYENPQTFFDGVECLIREGVNAVTIYPLQLFPGIDLAAKSARENYALRTRFRLADCGYGVYDGGRLIAVESEEIVVANRWSTQEDYFTVRRYGFFQQALFGRGYLGEFVDLCSEIGVPVWSVVRHLAVADYSRYPALGAVLAAHTCEAIGELKSTRQEVYQEVVDRLRTGDAATGIKLNLVYLGRLMSSPAALAELLQIITAYTENLLSDSPYLEIALTYLNEILPNRIVMLNANVEDHVRFRSRFNYSCWLSCSYDDISELLLAEPQEFQALVSDKLKSSLAAFDQSARSDLQAIFDRTPSTQLLRAVVPYRNQRPSGPG